MQLMCANVLKAETSKESLSERLTVEWPHGQWNSTARVRARRSGTFELMQHSHERSTSVLHTRGESHTLQAISFILWVSFMETVSKRPALQYSSLLLLFIIKYGWKSSREAPAGQTDALFKASTQPGVILKSHIIKKSFCFLFYNSQHTANPANPFRINNPPKKPWRMRGWN